MSTTLSLQELYTPVQDAVDRVGDMMHEIWTEALRLVDPEGNTPPRMGGKMLRPALCLMAAGAIGARNLLDYVRLATAYEALHLASLAHDDVIDKALLRRGRVSLNGLWDNHAAVLGGDYLVARAVEILAGYDSCPVIANAIVSVRRMAEGELTYFGRSDEPIRREDCLLLAEQKTASLFAEACSAATYVIDPTHRDALHRYGTQLGIAFQMVDDILDLTQHENKLGKPSCGDVAEGKKTLPIMFLREALDGADRERFESLYNTELTDADRAWIIDVTEKSGARERAEREAREFADAAIQALAPLPDSAYKESMAGIVEFILIRAS